MKSEIQNFLVNLLIVFLILTTTEYLHKFNFEVFRFDRLLKILPGLVFDSTCIGFIFICLILIKYRKNSKSN